jgi:lactate permease
MDLGSYQQTLDPLQNRLVSTAFAALPIVVLFWLLVPRRWPAPKAALGGAIAAILVAWIIYRMPLLMAGMAFVHGAAFGLFPVGWTIFNAMLLYNMTVETGYFSVVRRSVADLSADARIQAVLIGFAFGAFLEGAAGGGTPVAICGAIMVGLGFDPFRAAVICLIANTSPVAYGGLGTPLITLSGVTGLPTETLSIMAGHQLPLLSFVIPVYMIKCMCTWKQTWEVWPALLVAGASFAIFQYTLATIHSFLPRVILYPMTDVGGGIFSLVVTAIFLRFWKPRNEWHFGDVRTSADHPPVTEHHASTLPGDKVKQGKLERPTGSHGMGKEQPLKAGQIVLAWLPYAVMSVLLLATGLLRQQEQRGDVWIGPIKTRYSIPIYKLHDQSKRDPRVTEPPSGDVRCWAGSSFTPDFLSALIGLERLTDIESGRYPTAKGEKAEFDLPWLTAPGSAVFAAALLTVFILRMSFAQVKRVVARTVYQMRIPIPTIACMLGLSYVTRYGGLDATLGVAFAGTGVLYPFFAAILGWLGVFLTGTDAGSNALFGSLQKITATEVFRSGAFHHLSLVQSQILICTANSTGGVMGKMIDAQSICVATAATHQLGKEADIFKAVIWHSIILAGIVGLMTLVQAYIPPFTQLVPNP